MGSQEDHAVFNKFAIFYQLIQPKIELKRMNQTLSLINNLFENEQLSNFEMAIILLIICKKLLTFSDSDHLIVEFIQTDAINDYLNKIWPFYTKYVDEATNYKFEIEIDDYIETFAVDPYPLVDILKLCKTSKHERSSRILMNGNTKKREIKAANKLK